MPRLFGAFQEVTGCYVRPALENLELHDARPFDRTHLEKFGATVKWMNFVLVYDAIRHFDNAATYHILGDFESMDR